ncbi:response regulator [Dysgonomonas sp. Marseille-P4677]|uniref:response regulator n=1 Tax=Dysgonomonas sp. Marseille-P4677 TaxID=2364790 RepID=UPI001913FD0E|nr:response regulator [Dysgonomonas sp. Marseille-P4677]MBK5720331.1 response regulator [Dysgonomonas sp. Marseille-P4677]
MKIIMITLLIILSIFTGYSSNTKFYNINETLNINMREVASICKDNNGFIWGSSKTGILRLSGDDYRIYKLPYETANVIFVKLTYENQTLLAYTNNGQIFKYEEVSDKFSLVIDIRKPLNDYFLGISKVVVNNDGSYIIASSVGLYRYHNKELHRFEGFTTEIHTIEWYEDHRFFVICDGGIWLLNTNSKKSEKLCDYSSYKSIQFVKLFYDRKIKKLWLGSSTDGAFIFDISDKKLQQVSVKNFPKQPVQAFSVNSDSTILIGIDGQGVWELTRAGDKVLNIYKENADNPQSLKGNGVYDIFSEGNKRVWVCTYSGGISFFDRQTHNVTQISHNINNQNSLKNNDVNRIIEDSKGNIWFATNNGVSCWNVKTNKWKTYFDSKNDNAQVFLSLCEDNNGNIWAGTYSSGVHVIDGKTGEEKAYYSKERQNSTLTNNFIFDIFKDSDGDLWLGGPPGNIFCYKASENRFKAYPYQPVNVFAELSPDKILLGCTFGLCVLDKKEESTQIILDGHIVQDILIMGDDIWLGTSGDGLLCFNLESKSVNKFTTKSGLLSDYINNILLINGYLWLGTENGLCKFDPNDHNVSVYSSISPTLNVSFNPNSGFKLKSGELIWGTNNGAIMFDPISLQPIPSEGRIFFQDLIVSGRSIRKNSAFTLDEPLDALKKISLDYTQNTLTLEFLFIGASTADSKFSWKMEGIDSDWTEPTNYRNLTYTNLPSGSFELKIRMFDSSLSEIISERQLSIYIAPPFWNTWWFRLLIILILSYIVYSSLKFYINRLKQQHTEDKVRFFTNMAHDIRTSLTLIKAPVEELSEEPNLTERGKYFLCLAIEQIRRLSSVTTQLLDFQKVDIGKEQMSLSMIDIVRFVSHRKLMFESLAKNKNIELILIHNRPYFYVKVDEVMMTKIVDNLISNAIKYSYPNSQVEITMTFDKNDWIMEVQDYGIGISKKEQNKLFQEFYRSENAINSKIVGSGIGLLLVKHYVVLHGGSISFDSRENEGSKFKITMPIKAINEDDEVFTLNREDIDFKQTGFSQRLSIKDNSIDKDMQILVVEDNDDLRNFIQHSLSYKLNVSVAQNGDEAWSLIQKTMPDLVVSDIMMPEMDGYELCNMIKSTFETSHIPVILLTALTEREEQLRGLAIGADDYITKPFDMVLLFQKIVSIIQNRNAVRDRALKAITKGGEEQVFANEFNDQFVKKAIEVVHANMDNPKFGKDDFANEMYVSPSLLYKKIKTLTNQSPVDFIKGIRLNHALELLQTRKYSVTEVSVFCGFSSVGYFSTAFKKHFDKSPTEI